MPTNRLGRPERRAATYVLASGPLPVAARPGRWLCRLIAPVLLVAGCVAEAADPPPRLDASPDEMAAAAEAFLASLSETQRGVAVYSMDDDTARTSWSNLPAMFVTRRGVRLGDLDDEQRRRFHGLLRASSSSQGYQKLAGIIRLDGILHDEATEAVAQGTRRLPPELIESWDDENYWVVVFGSPTSDEQWGWQLSGHHLAANFTSLGDSLSFTPLFLGAEPNEVMAGPEAGWRALSHEAERGFELLQALSVDQRGHAVLGHEVPDDILTGPGRKGSLEEFNGLPASELSDAQRMLLFALIDEFVANVDQDVAAAQLARIQANGLGALHFAWMGPQDDVSGRYYYRVHSPSVLIEYVVEEGVGGAAANHVHSIIRDPGNDYGEDWLGKHYEEHHVRNR